MLRRQCRSRNHTSFWLYWECYSSPSTCVRNRWVSGRSKGKCRHRNDFRFVHKPNDAVQTVDLLVGVARRWFLGYKRCRDQTFGWVCHVCYQTPDWIAVDRSDGHSVWIRYKQDQEIKVILCEGFWTLLLILKTFFYAPFFPGILKLLKKPNSIYSPVTFWVQIQLQPLTRAGVFPRQWAVTRLDENLLPVCFHHMDVFANLLKRHLEKNEDQKHHS